VRGLLLALLWASAYQAWAQDEVPFITTPDAVTVAMLQMAQVKVGDFVIDLGSGDGRIVITAAKRFGARGLGVEIVPDLVAQSQRNAVLAGVAARTEFKVQDLFDTDLRAAQVVTMYLLPEFNLQLRPRLLALAPGTRIVSHDWDMGEWVPDRRQTLAVPEKTIGQDKRSTVYLWVVPAQVHGLWCTAGATLNITQRFQAFSAALNSTEAAPTAVPLAVFDGRINGAVVHAGTELAGARFVLRWSAGALLMERADGRAVLLGGQQFQRAGSAGCADRTVTGR